MSYRVIFYETDKGRCYVDEYLDSLPVKPRAKSEKWMQKLEQHGPNLPRPYADVVKGKIRELRVAFSPNQHRYLYFFDGKDIVITHGIVKNTGKIPPREIERAERLMGGYIHRKKEGGLK